MSDEKREHTHDIEDAWWWRSAKAIAPFTLHAWPADVLARWHAGLLLQPPGHCEPSVTRADWARLLRFIDMMWQNDWRQPFHKGWFREGPRPTSARAVFKGGATKIALQIKGFEMHPDEAFARALLRTPPRFGDCE
jgi:hypothetical protein